jgi:hypothetical protein
MYKSKEQISRGCKLCIRKHPNFCKRHTPKVTITRIKLYTQEQVDKIRQDDRGEFQKILNSGKKMYELGLEDAITYIGKHQGWEESEDFYRSHFGLKPKYK